MGAKVVYRDAAGHEGTVELGDQPAFVGRSRDCAVRSDDAMVSRKHAVIRFHDGHHVIEDLGSANGIEVNGTKVESHVLSHNDTARCGSLWLRYIDDASATEALPLPPIAPMPAAAPRTSATAAESARTLVLPGRAQRQVIVPDMAEVQRLRAYIEELLRQLMELREELDRARAEHARMAAELAKHRGD